MVEHVMAALAGLQIDNVEVHCTACEMPAMDGSCLALALHIQNAERLVQPAPKTALRITEVFRVGNDQQWITVEPFDAELTDASRSIYEYQLDFGAQSPIAPSTYTWELNPDTFVSEVAPARTFISLNEARLLQSQGLAQHVTERDLIVFDEHGPVANELRFVDECTRHKTLDLIGDLALAGCDLEGRVIAHRSGHQLNGLMAQTLRDHMLAMLTPSQSYRRRAA
jgi:UDP-3-O-acyl-N-acetylglucosamine deacetylase